MNIFRHDGFGTCLGLRLGSRLAWRLSLSLALLTAQVCLAEPPSLPTLEVEDLHEKKIKFPGELPHQSLVLVVGFTKDSQKWTTFCADHIEKDHPALIYTLAELEGVPFFIKGTVKKSIRGAVSETRKDKYFLAFDRKDEFKKLVEFDPKNESDAYLIGLKWSTTRNTHEIQFTLRTQCKDTDDAALNERITRVSGIL